MNIANQTLASIVTQHTEAVPVLEKYHLDFCCKGKRTLSEACLEKGLSYEQITKEIEEQAASTQNRQMAFTDMTAEQIISYILIYHHFYVKQSMPVIYTHIEKVASKHGGHYPYMLEVLRLFDRISKEMTEHMLKEEQILFPRIKEVESLAASHQPIQLHPAYINGPVDVMEHEHDHAGEIMFTIRKLTNNYTPPDDACTTFKVCLAELKEFEEDLHRHVHLENNILFPMAKKYFVSSCSI